jgi:uncharacterized membrane protein YhaH (DUF805 family)
MRLGRLFLSPLGRLRRSYFWLGFVATMLLTSVTRGSPMDLFTLDLHGWNVTLILLAVAVQYSQFCLTAKRLHDLGVSAWWVLYPLGFFAVAGAVMYFAPAAWERLEVVDGALTWRPAFMIPWFFFWGWLAFWPGQEETNRFGPPVWARASELRPLTA